MVHLEPWIHQRIKTSNVSPRFMTSPISPSLKNPYTLNRVAFLRQFYNIASERAIKITYELAKCQTILGLKAAKYPFTLNRVAFLRQFYNIASERAIKITYELAKCQTILGLKAAKYFDPDMFNIMTNLANNHTRYIINTCILVKFFKLQRVPSSNKRENTILSSLKSIKDSHQPSLDIGKRQVVNFNPLTSI